jgi:hypothetical protein
MNEFMGRRANRSLFYRIAGKAGQLLDYAQRRGQGCECLCGAAVDCGFVVRR